MFMRGQWGRIAYLAVWGLLGMWAALSLMPPRLEDLYRRFMEMNTETTPVAQAPVLTPQTPNNQNPIDETPEQAGGQKQETTSGEQEAESESGEVAGTGSPTVRNAGQRWSPNNTSGNTSINPGPDTELDPPMISMPGLALLGLIVGVSLGSLTLRGFDRTRSSWSKMPDGDRMTVFIGTFLGIIAGIIVSLPFQFVYQGRPQGTLLTLGLIAGCSAAIVFSLRSMSGVLPWEAGRKMSRRTGIKLLDTNVLIDGRVYDLINAGFIDGELYIPRFVLAELQYIADSSDALRRQRGRRGLEVLKRIQNDFEVDVGSYDKYAGTTKDDVDSRLVKLAKAIGADLVTNDYNLNRVASIEEVRVLNINEIALALRPNVLPGEPLMVSVLREGSQSGQGVGYLDDGTMVVVEGGSTVLGQTLEVTVTQLIQTDRGKMIFADLPTADEDTRRRGRRKF